ncbi:hypothetical protein [Corynebacterium massiliense]|uniref:Uncharacterized protein n=1 Tax=Corynebacterium massiliense DSM 45435 TaxID=1121364 RepID=A0ABY7U8B4_9CORY|nr:hypothetical protein [Corynebacterium massiliense]WCZ32948.1 hypothetical protein CMASS_07590 [Corynebacterium massiliense DSM 45435]
MSWLWTSGELLTPNGAVLAVAQNNSLYCDRQEILLESSSGGTFYLRGTVSDGRMFYLRQAGLTTSRLDVNCDGREYRAERIKPLRRARRILRVDDGAEVLHTDPRLRAGELQVSQVESQLSLVDAAFITWGCVLLDAPDTQVRI